MVSKTKADWVDFKEIKSKVGLREILARYGLLEDLKQKGDEVMGLCPFHKETKGSFRANLAKNAFQCFGCKAKGNILDFVSLKEDVNVREAALLIKDWFGIASESSQKAPGEPKTARDIETSGQEKREANGAVSEEERPVNPPLTFSLKSLDPEHPYLFKRGLSKETIQHFGLGYCSRGMLKGWIAIPIHDEQGRLVAYCGRAVSDGQIREHGKYKLPPGFVKSAVVYNLHRQKANQNQFILVESFFSVFKLHQAGFSNTLALMGSSLSPAQEELIAKALGSQGRLVLLFDADDEGRCCADDCLARLGRRVFVKAIELSPAVRKPHRLTPDQIKSLF